MDFFKVQKLFLKLSAMVPVDFRNYLPKKLSFLSFFLAKGHPTFLIFLALHIAVLYAKTTYDNFGGDLDNLSDSLALTLIYSFTTFATLYFIILQKKLLRISECISKGMRIISAPGVSFVTVRDSYERAKLYTIIWLSACTAGVVIWVFFPILTLQRIHPLNCWYPFDVMKPLMYEFIYIIQFLGQLQVGIVYGNGSVMYISFIILICGQYDILFCSMKNFIYTAEILAGTDVEKLMNFHSPSVEDEGDRQFYISKEGKTSLKYLKGLQKGERVHIISGLREAIKDCVQHHQFILRVAQMVEDFYTFYCLVKSLQITFQLCLLAFIVVNTTGFLYRIMNLGGYLLLTSTELLLFSYFGELAQIQSLKVGEALLSNPWYKYSTVIKTDILIILQGTLRPVVFTGGKFFPMNIDRLRIVIASAFSFLTLLQALDEK